MTYKPDIQLHDSLPPGEIRAIASIPVMTVVLTYVFVKFSDEALKDAYRIAKQAFVTRPKEFQEEKNAGRASRHRIQFSLSQDGELIVKKTDE